MQRDIENSARKVTTRNVKLSDVLVEEKLKLDEINLFIDLDTLKFEISI